jgi:hypothetical protein
MILQLFYSNFLSRQLCETDRNTVEQRDWVKELAALAPEQRLVAVTL